MKTQNSIYKTFGNSLAGMNIILFSGLLMAPSCRNEKYYEDENYATGTQIYPYEPQTQAQNNPPQWAPAYSSVNVRYYYFPDYYMYYDVWSSQYVYWDGFNWVYVNSYPAFIGPFDPYYAHIIIINNNVHNPWLNHNYYVDHYPQYYYQNNYYGQRENSVVRGYDENQGQAVYTPRKSNEQKGSPQNPKQENSNRKFQGNNNSGAPINKNREQPAMKKTQEQPRDNFKGNYPRQPAQRQKQWDNDNRQKNFNDNRDFQQSQQRRESPSNFQAPQQRQRDPLQKQTPSGGFERKGGGNGKNR